MPARLVALDEGADIPLDRTMVVVGRHPQCDARLDSLRVSRHHCCMTQDNGEIVVRDLGSTNGIRINGQRVEIGRLRPGDELSIAHIRYRFDTGSNQDMTLLDAGHSVPFLTAHPPEANGNGVGHNGATVPKNGRHNVPEPPRPDLGAMAEFEKPLAAAMRDILPAGLADKYRIQVIVKMENADPAPPGAGVVPGSGAIAAPAPEAACQPDSSR